MSDVLIFLGILGCGLAVGIVAAVLFGRYERRRPYLAARWDDKAGDWVNEEEHDVGPDPLLLLDELTAHLKAYGAEIADLYETATTDHQGD